MKQYPFNYDLGLDMNPASGKLLFSDAGTISCEEDGKVLFTIGANDIKELKVLSDAAFEEFDRAFGHITDINERVDR